MATTLTATAEPANGWTRLVVSSDASGATWATITRTVDGLTDYVRWARVAVLEGASPKTLTVLDAEAPYDKTADYSLSILNGSGTQVATATDSATLTDDGQDRLVAISGPGMVYPITVVDFPEVSTDARGGVFDVIGRRQRVAVTDVRSGESGTIRVLAEDRGDQLRALLADGGIIGLRTPAARGYGTPVLYGIGKVKTTRIGIAGEQLRYVDLEVSEVASVAVAAAAATPITWAAVMAYAATWADVKAEPGWPTWYKVKTVPTTAL